MLIEYRRDGRIYINGKMVGRTDRPDGVLTRLLGNLKRAA